MHTRSGIKTCLKIEIQLFTKFAFVSKLIVYLFIMLFKYNLLYASVRSITWTFFNFDMLNMILMLNV